MIPEKGHPPFEELEHTADLRLGVHGGSLEELFIHAAQGMFHLMRCQPQGEGQAVARQVALESYDLEALLVDWLNELIYLREANQECYDACEIIRLEPTRLEAIVRGTTHHPPQKVIKAATFSGLEIVRDAADYGVTITFDV
jgi:SHS2 domain-containing protein